MAHGVRERLAQHLNELDASLGGTAVDASSSTSTAIAMGASARRRRASVLAGQPLGGLAQAHDLADAVGQIQDVVADV